MAGAGTEDSIQGHLNPAAKQGQHHQQQQRRSHSPPRLFFHLLMSLAVAEKHHEHQSEAVDSGKEGADDTADPEQQTWAFHCQGGKQNFILGIESRSKRQRRQGRTTDDE